VSLCQSARNDKRPVGSGTRRDKDETLPLLETELIGQFEFAEWTPENHLRHSRFVGLREDKDPRKIRKEI
jgi:ATP-dependent DNA ligase